MDVMIGVLICVRAPLASISSGDRKSKLRSSFKIMKCSRDSDHPFVRTVALSCPSNITKLRQSTSGGDSLAPTSRPIFDRIGDRLVEKNLPY